MPIYRAIVIYSFKKGKEEEGVKFIETELLKPSKDSAHHSEILINESDPCTVIHTAMYDDKKHSDKYPKALESKKFQNLWAKAPHRQIFAVQSHMSIKMKLAA